MQSNRIIGLKKCCYIVHRAYDLERGGPGGEDWKARIILRQELLVAMNLITFSYDAKDITQRFDHGCVLVSTLWRDVE